MGELASEASLRGRLQLQIWEKCGDCGRVPSQLQQPPAIEPGDPQRCGLTARVAGSSLPAGATRPLSHGFQPCQLSQRESQGAGDARPVAGGELAGTRRRSHPYELKNLEPSANYAPGTMRYVCVGADSIRPVVSPPGKQRRRKAPTMHHQTFYDEIRRYHESNMAYWQHCCIGWCVTVLLKNLQRWRADDIRPYTVCATE